MRKRELQSIPLKLSELKEYENAKLERQAAKEQNKTKPMDEDNENDEPDTTPIANVKQKTQKEIQSRINTTL